MTTHVTSRQSASILVEATPASVPADTKIIPRTKLTIQADRVKVMYILVQAYSFLIMIVSFWQVDSKVLEVIENDCLFFR